MFTRPRPRSLALALLVGALAAAPESRPSAQQGPRAPEHAQQYRRLLIRNAMVIYGSAKPPYGPMDILLQDGMIADVRPSEERITDADTVIDATGKYVMPGIVNTHMHWHEERAPGMPQPIQYERNLYLASGVTTAREVGGSTSRTKQWREDSNAHRIVSPRILMWNRPNLGRNRTPDEIRAGVRQARAEGFDGLKIGGLDRDQLEALMDEAKKQGLCTTAHIGVEETTAKDYVDLGVCSIEHFYGVAEAAIDGIQRFPAEMNYNNETHRFGRAGELFGQADREQVMTFVEHMAEKKVGWSPTMSIYEASRDLLRSQTVPWFREYLHPSLEEYFKASVSNHGSYFFGWTTAQEATWKQMYRVWMDALRHFGVKGGLIATGDDAGYIWSLYGFGIIRELELHEEAGFHPLEVLQHATWNGAQMVGLGERLGKVRTGWVADLLVVNGNPVENLRVLNLYGTDVMQVNGRIVPNYTAAGPSDRVENVRGGGIEWTIKDGIPYHVPALMKDVKDMVTRDRTSRQRHTTAGK